MNLIDERDVRTIHRKLQKKKFDDILQLSVGKEQKVRLLDEGTVVDASGSPLFYLTKGTLKAYLDKLPDDYEGSINLGHMDFATFPILLGKWTKKDFSLADNGDGRMGLDVILRLDEDNFLVKELRRAEYDLGVSAEFGYHVNEELSVKYGIEIIDEIFISDFAIVGECGNVGSSGINLGGKAMKLQELQVALEKEGAEAGLEALNKKLDALLEEEKSEEPKEEAKAEEPKEDEKKEDPAEEPQEEKSELSVVMENMIKEMSGLKAENEALKAQLSAKDKAEKEFVEKFKKLSVSLAPKTESVTIETEVFTDGLGE